MGQGPLFCYMDVTFVSVQQEQMTRIAALLAPSVEALGFTIVRVKMMGGKRSPTLQVMAERTDQAEMRVDDCASLSRAISALLDVEDPIAGSYLLEVSSPGIDRPLTRLADFERFEGHEAKLETVRPIGRRKRFRGRLMGIDGDCVRVELNDGSEEVADIPFAELAEAKLVLTDALIAATQKRRGE